MFRKYYNFLTLKRNIERNIKHDQKLCPACKRFLSLGTCRKPSKIRNDNSLPPNREGQLGEIIVLGFNSRGLVAERLAPEVCVQPAR